MLDDMENHEEVKSPTSRLGATSGEAASRGNGLKSEADVTSPAVIRSSPPIPLRPSSSRAVHEFKATGRLSGSTSDSEAETIVEDQNERSPATARHDSIKKESKSEKNGDEDRDVVMGDIAAKKDSNDGRKASGKTTATSSLGKRKRPKHSNLKDDHSYAGNSSGLSSVPTSPVATTRSSLSKAADTDSEISRSPSPHQPDRIKSKSVDRHIKKRRAHDDGSGGEADLQKLSKHKITEASDRDKQSKSARRAAAALSAREPNSRTRTRSASPRSRSHRRSASIKEGPGLSVEGRKRIPPPLRGTRDRQSADYHSDDSSASGSPHPRSSRARQLASLSHGDSITSPAKMPSHKKYRDNIGRTFLARACAVGELDNVKLRLEERPEDIDVADYAGNAPLQIASLEGFEDIVKLLLDSKCDVHCVNNDKDTPLLDAVENGHLEVVQLLLAAGVNPRRGNVNGEEPLDRINDELDNSKEIRKVLLTARSKTSDIRRPSEDHSHDLNDDRSSHGTGSPRHSPSMQPPSHQLSSNRRGASGRSAKTSNHILYMPMDSKALRAAAGKGDEEAVIRILQVRDGFDDPESLVAAARGGHDNVINLLLGLGGANPDPPPVKSVPADFSTPILAALGRDNIEVIKLLLGQREFDPTRSYGGQTYYEIARKRAGPRWREEVEMLKEAYQNYAKKHNLYSSSNNRRDIERDSKRQGRGDSAGVPASDGKKGRSSREHSSSESRKKIRSESTSEARVDSKKSGLNSSRVSSEETAKRGPGRPRKEEQNRSAAASDRETTPLGPPKPKLKSKNDIDGTANTSESDQIKPRRKLVSGRDLKGERDRQRQASVASTTSTTSAIEKAGSVDGVDTAPSKLSKPPLSNKTSDPDNSSEKILGRARPLKREESRNKSGIERGKSPVKRLRSSATPPPRSDSQDSVRRKVDDDSAPPKKRRLDSDRKLIGRSEGKLGSSPESKQKPSSPKAAKEKASGIKTQESEMTNVKTSKRAEDKHKLRESVHGKEKSSEGATTDKKDVKNNKDVGITTNNKNAILTTDRRMEEAEKVAATAKAKEAEKATATTKAKEAARAERAAKEEEAARIEGVAKAEKAKKAEEAAEQARLAAKRAADEEAAKKKREQEEAEAKLIKEAEEEKEQQRLEDERKAREQKELEEQTKRKEEEARLLEQKLKEEAEARRVEEEERMRLYQEQQRLKQEELERRRAARLQEQRLEQQRVFREQEEARRAKLPPLLCWFDKHPEPATSEIAMLFCDMQGVRYDTIRPEATGGPEGREQWLLNTQVALLLGEKDLHLSRYTAWERIPASDIAKQIIWRVEADIYCMTNSALRNSGEGNVSFRRTEKLREQSLPLFMGLDLFFVKVSDFMFIVPKFPHLRNLKMHVDYRELPPDASYLNKWTFPPKWKQDPDAGVNLGFAPGGKYYINGEFVGENKPCVARVSSKPFPEVRVPRRGFNEVFPGDPEYERLCIEQDLEHLLDRMSHNGTHLSPSTNGMMPAFAAPENNITPPDSVISTNGEVEHATEAPRAITAETQKETPVLTNGVHGI